MAGRNHLTGGPGALVFDYQSSHLLNRQADGTCLVIAEAHALYLPQAGDEAVSGVLQLFLLRGGDEGMQELGICLQGLHPYG